MHERADERLRAELVAGREDAYASLYDRYARPLFRVAWTMLRSRQDAEDAVQEVFLGLYRARASLGRVENLSAYLFSALRHAVGRLATRKKPEALPVEELADPASAKETQLDPELSDCLDQSLAALPAEQREVLSLKIDGGLTFEEVAAVLGIRPKTAASRYRYALEKLKSAMSTESHERQATSPKHA